MTPPISLTNGQFILTVFGKEAGLDAHVTGFSGDPNDINAPPWRWGGKRFGKGGRSLILDPDNNNYYCVSTFIEDQAGRHVRADALCSTMWVLVCDDVGDGPTAKITMKALSKMFPFSPSFSFETSPGNSQVGYIVMGGLVGRPLAKYVETHWTAMTTLLSKTEKNPGNNDLTRYARLPQGCNGKPSANNFRTVVNVWQPENQITHADLIAVLHLDAKVFADAVAGIDAPGIKPAYVFNGTGQTSPEDDPSGWGAALNKRGLLLGSHKPGVWDIICPNAGGHTQGITGTAYLGNGSFKCHHSGCDWDYNEWLRRMEEANPGITAEATANIFVKAEPIDMEASNQIDVSHTIDDLSQRYIWMPYEGQGMWLDIRTKKVQTQGAINTTLHSHANALAVAHAGWVPGTGKMPKPHDSLKQAANRITSTGKVYRPGLETLIPNEASTEEVFVNMWEPATIGVGNIQVDPAVAAIGLAYFKMLIEQLTGDAGDAGGLDTRMYDWLALVVTDPGRKPKWHWMIFSDEGIGKDTIASDIVTPLVGYKNAVTIGASEAASDYNTWAGMRFITINELHAAASSRRSEVQLFDKIKIYLANPPHEIYLNPKFERKYPATNVGAYMLFSNHENTLSITRTDRRLCVVDRKGKPNVILDTIGWRKFHEGLASNNEAKEAVGQWLRERYAVMSAADHDILNGPAPMTEAKQDMADAAVTGADDYISDFLEAAKERSPLWTAKDLKKHFEARGQDARYLSYGRFTGGLKRLGAWRPSTHRDGRVSGLGGSLGEVVWAMYEDPKNGLTKDVKMPELQVKELMAKYSADGVTNITTIFSKISTLDEPEDKKDDNTTH